MATYYADLDVPSYPGSAGSEADPFGALEFYNTANGGSGDTFNLRGNYELTASLIDSGNTYQAWDLDEYGPWRIYGGTTYFYHGGPGSMTGGIIEAKYVGNSGNSYTDMYVRATVTDVVCAGNSVRSVFVAADAIENHLGGDVTNCVLNLSGKVEIYNPGPTITNCLTNKADFASLWENQGGGAPADGGGQEYGASFTLPEWDSENLSDFCLCAGRSPKWAKETIYINISSDYDETTPRSNTAEHPGTWDDLLIYSGEEEDDMFEVFGDRTLTVDSGPSFAETGIITDGWDNSSGSDSWKIDMSSFDYKFNNATVGYTVKNLGLVGAKIVLDPTQDGMKFKNGYFYNAVQVIIDSYRNDSKHYFYGCTFKSPVVKLSYVGNYDITWTFNYCLFDNAVINSQYRQNAIFKNCVFVGKSRAEVESNISPVSGTYTFINCTFNASLAIDLPETIANITPAKLNFYATSLPLIDPPSEWTTDDYAEGFKGNQRVGVGAFYFMLPGADFEGTPRSGKAPLEVDFTDKTVTFGTVSVSWEWKFGDGQTSGQKNPTHIYTMPGKYDVTLTVTDEYGFTSTVTKTAYIRVYDYYYDDSIPDSSLTDRCYRLPVKPGNGFGVAEYKDSLNTGKDWIWPPAGVGSELCYDINKKELAVVLDSKTQKVYRINDKTIWKDRVGGYNNGNTIISEIHPAEKTAIPGEHIAIKHVEQHLTFKPFKRENRGADGFDSEGFLNDMRVDLMLMQNGNPTTPIRQAIDVTKDGDLVFQEEYQARSLQPRIKIWESGWRLARIQGLYETIDRAQGPDKRKMTETTRQENLTATPLFWVSRNYNPVLNLATGDNATGTVTAVDGPDGRELSAISITGSLSDTLVSSLDSDYTLTSWIKSNVSTVYPMKIWEIGDLIIEIIHSGGYYLRYDDGINPVQDFEIDGNRNEWEMFAVVRKELYITLYRNTTLLGTFSLASKEDHGTDMRFCENSIGFDPKILPRAIDQEVLSYYYNQVIKGTQAVLPPF